MQWETFPPAHTTSWAAVRLVQHRSVDRKIKDLNCSMLFFSFLFWGLGGISSHSTEIKNIIKTASLVRHDVKVKAEWNLIKDSFWFEAFWRCLLLTRGALADTQVLQAIFNSIYHCTITLLLFYSSAVPEHFVSAVIWVEEQTAETNSFRFRASLTASIWGRADIYYSISSRFLKDLEWWSEFKVLFFILWGFLSSVSTAGLEAPQHAFCLLD